MKIKFKVSEIVLLIDSKLPILKVHKQLSPVAEKYNIKLLEPQFGVDYLQWTLPNGEWTSFRNLDDAQKPEAAQAYMNGKSQFLSALGDYPDKQFFLTVPSEVEHIFYHKNGNQWDIAVVAWGYRYPKQADHSELETWITKSFFQDVAIGFSWNDRLIPSMQFRLQQQLRTTGADGLYDFDNKMEVGRQVSVATLAGTTFTLVVEQGKKDYIFDLTKNFTVEIVVLQDNKPASERECELRFGVETHTLLTNESGKATLRLALNSDTQGDIAPHQPLCTVTCQSQSDSKTPINEGDVLYFSFSFEEVKTETPPPPPPSPETPPPPPEKEKEYVTIKLLDYAGYPLQSLPFILITKKKGNTQLTTDENGQCKVEKDMFTHKEKIRVKLNISPEYQDMHDIHLDTKKSKKNPK